ncbi:hypothetical protein M427DRAFT_59160 [Gonapodya prolifera JEL478]|uniref:Nicotinamide-nucleotide adenylyltransferase n=1 Tax=Gonapodya prolifera (strain JEL478) TaxID=1344416 RepID=A0A139A7S8_GONPJ|nr:hypothetical protein M427DRAFT_59160 [Gonapodya prolifera JEL478]|eukprot:KXS12840.1 hypothetical protein M427DRAFT_59160 [Gonapodya prolifera JEL478]
MSTSPSHPIDLAPLSRDRPRQGGVAVHLRTLATHSGENAQESQRGYLSDGSSPNPLVLSDSPNPKWFRSAHGEGTSDVQRDVGNRDTHQNTVSLAGWHKRLEHALETLNALQSDLRLSRQTDPAAQVFRLVATNNSSWPNNASDASTQPAPSHNLVVLDSSFNPPTLAHQRLVSLAQRAFPPSSLPLSYLLLLATSNMDKQITGASLADRLVMMERTAERLAELDGHIVGVACTSAGRFLEKAQVIRRYLGGGDWRAHFLLGWDTVVRFFDEKYYPGGVEGGAMTQGIDAFFSHSTLIIADRPHPTKVATDASSSDLLADYVETLPHPLRKYFDSDKGWIRMLPGWETEVAGQSEGSAGWRYADMSSTRARELLAKVGWIEGEENLSEIESRELAVSMDTGVAAWVRERKIYVT